MPISLFQIATLVLAGASAIILIAFLVKRPAIKGAVKVWLLFGIGVLPIGAAMSGNVVGYERTKERGFCASCHTMDSFAHDAADPQSKTLASMHSRNKMFGEESCYTCHADYEMFGAILTKLDGMKHMWVYYTHPPEHPKLYKPFPNSTCTRCHSTTLEGWTSEPEHQAVAEDIAAGKTSCAASGCHGPAHPTATATAVKP